MSASNKPPLVLIEWLDSFGCSSNWQEISDCAPTPLHCKSVGWLIYNGSDCKVVVPHMTEADHESAKLQGCGDMTIPIGVVVRIDLLKPDDLGTAELDWTPEQLNSLAKLTSEPQPEPTEDLVRIMKG